MITVGNLGESGYLTRAQWGKFKSDFDAYTLAATAVPGISVQGWARGNPGSSYETWLAQNPAPKSKQGLPGGNLLLIGVAAVAVFFLLR